MSSTLLLKQSPACLVCLTWLVCVIKVKWPYSWCFMGFICSKQFTAFLCNFYLTFSLSFQLVHMVQTYSCTDIDTTWQKSRFILSEISDFHMIDNLSIAVHAFPMCMLTLLSVDEILLCSILVCYTQHKH